MHKLLKLVIITTIFTLLSLFIISCGGDNHCKVNINEVDGSCQVIQTTPLGATVYNKTSVSADVLNKVDLGLTRTFENARTTGYTNKLNYSDYSIYIPTKPCVLSPETRTPSMVVNDAFLTYDGSIYDQINSKGKFNETDALRIAAGYVHLPDGKSQILAAEMIINLGTSGSGDGSMFVCEGVLEEGSANGAEHILIANNITPNRPNYFEETMYHLSISHPLLPVTSQLSKGKTVIQKVDKKTTMVFRPVL